MEKEKAVNIIVDAVSVYGIQHQTAKLFEEMAELQQALCKFADKRDTIEHVQEELADVQITLWEMIHVYGTKPVSAQIDAKLKRLQQQLKEHKP